MNPTQGRTVAGSLAFDTQSLDQLKLQAKGDPGKAVVGAAKQFESMFLGMVLKSMREATPQDGMFDNEQTKLYTSLLDQQLAQHIAARGTGLSEVMARQLSAHAPTTGTAAAESDAGLLLAEASPHEIAVPDLMPGSSPTTLDFANRTLLRATEAARATSQKSKVQMESAPKPLPLAAPPVDVSAVQTPAVDAPAAASSTPLTKTRDFIQRV
jgi:flagellar protein FlgJ